ncbi:hypothetical protein HRbin39_00918 [bacterium HR39]|nr:hypothetical protein HRbin39_00918 [bacterium HR39]
MIRPALRSAILACIVLVPAHASEPPTLLLPLRAGDAPSRPLAAARTPALAVFDHSLADPQGRLAPYGCDGTVVAFDGTRAERRDGADRAGCDAPAYRLPLGGPVQLDGANYVGRGGDPPRHLAFDGHPGWDFAAPPGTPVVAAAAGVLTPVEAGVPEAEAGDGALALRPLEHPNIVLFYLGLDPSPARLPDGLPGCAAEVELPRPGGATVEAGCIVGRVASSGRLHFEVLWLPPPDAPAGEKAVACPHDPKLRCIPLDPFGWDGPATVCGFLQSGDPYACLTGVAQRRLWADPDRLDPGSRLAPRLRALGGDEAAMRRMITLLDAAGEPAQALALPYVEFLAARGDVAMQLRAARGHLEGNGVPVDPASGRAWLEKAAAAGDPEAMAWLAQLLMCGIGGGREVGRARELLRRAEAAGVAAAVRTVEARVSRCGRWSGWGDQGSSRWSIEVDFDTEPVRVSYPSLDCSGYWTLQTERADGTRIYRERITEGRTRCIEEGLMILRAISDDTIFFEYKRHPDGPVTARGTLERQ